MDGCDITFQRPVHLSVVTNTHTYVRLAKRFSKEAEIREEKVCRMVGWGVLQLGRLNARCVRSVVRGLNFQSKHNLLTVDT